jgi:hypothetical protein
MVGCTVFPSRKDRGSRKEHYSQANIHQASPGSGSAKFALTAFLEVRLGVRIT